MQNLPHASALKSSFTLEHSPVGRAEFLLLVLILLVFSEGLLPKLLTDEDAVDGSPVLRMLWLPIYAIAFAGLVWKIKNIAQVAMRLPFLMGLLIVCALSFLWSIDPGLSFRRSIAILMTTAAGLYIGTRYNWQTMLRALALAWLIVGLVSFFTGLLMPSLGRMQEIHIGAWSGLYFEKNQLGGHMARSAVFAAILVIMDRTYRKTWCVALLLSIALVVLSTSKSALLGLIVGLSVVAVCAWMKQGLRVGLVTLWLGAIFVAIAAGILVFAPQIVFDLLGRDATLTGRTDIWIVLAEMIQNKPILGYGYGAFWAPDSEPGNWVRDLLQWDAPTAHNGWLEVTIALGAVGLVFLTLDFMMTVWRALMASIHTWAGVFALAFCAQFFLFSLSESASLQQNSIVWLIYVAIAAKLTMRPKHLIAVKRVPPLSKVLARAAVPG